jgi:endonuclease YncB( thermonuclease family)
MDKQQALKVFGNHDNKTPKFTFAGQKFWCRVVEMHDCDTFQGLIEFAGKVYKIIVRVMGVDSAEMTSKDPVVKAWAIKARNRMLSLVAPAAFKVDGTYAKKDIVKGLKENMSLVWMEALDFDKFSRVLGNLYFNEGDTITIQSRLVTEGYCKPYMGGTKSPWVPEDCKLNE